MEEVAVSAGVLWGLFPLIGLPAGVVAKKMGRPEILTRFFIWMAILPVFLGASFLGEGPFVLLLLGCAGAASFELARLAPGKSLLPLWPLATILSCTFIFWSQYLTAESPLWPLLFAGTVTGIIISFVLMRSGRLVHALLILSASMGAGLTPWIFLQQKPGGFRFVLFAFSVVVMSDIMAFVSGKLMSGRHPFPKLSPNKTTWGYFGGTLSGVVVSYLLAFCVPELDLLHILAAGLLLALSGAGGDLVASAVKRYFDVKDYSSLLGPLGGMLDRIDSMLGAGWAFFLYLQFQI